MAKLTLFR